MKSIISPIEISLLEKELTPAKLVRATNFGKNEIYIITHHDSPNLMLEIGRLREVSFREAGGGTGKEVDIDKFDTAETPYKQLIVWNRSNKEIVGGYRFLDSKSVIGKDVRTSLATAKLFHFSDTFIKKYLPYTIELGRSFVQPKYQSSRKGIFSLDNLWDGLGALTVQYPETQYFFGKVTMYTTFNPEARDAILFFLNKFFPDKEKTIYPHKPLDYKTDVSHLDAMFNKNTYKKNHIVLNRIVRKHGEMIPPLFNAYMNLSPNMKTFGTAINDSFGEVEETGILVNINDIYPSKKIRHISTYKK
jgi:Acetyltransferase (GNAT) domain